MLIQFGHFSNIIWSFPIAFKSFVNVVYTRDGISLNRNGTNVNWVTQLTAIARYSLTQVEIESPAFGTPDSGFYIAIGY